MEDVMEELYRQGLSGDEEAQLDFITFIVTETELPMPDMAEVWLRRLAEKGLTRPGVVIFRGPWREAVVRITIG